MPADKKSSLVQIAQDVLDTTFGAIKIVNADPSSGGATQVTAAAILVTVDAINAKTPAAPATAGNQTSTNTKLDTLIAQTDGVEGSLTAIDGKTPALGQALAAASSPVVLTAAQITTLTPQTNAITDAQIRATALPVSGTVAVTGVATETTLAALNTKIPAQGQALAAASIPVVLTAAQITTLTPVSALTDAQLRATAVPVSVSGVATAANQTTEITSLGSIDTKAVQNTLNYGAATGAVRVASQPGNASGIADFNLGTTGAQTLRVAANVGLNGVAALSGFATPTSGSLNVAAMIGVGTGAVTNANPLPVDIFTNNTFSTGLTATRRTFATSSGLYVLGTQSIMMGFDFVNTTHKEVSVDVSGNLSTTVALAFAARIVSASQLPYIVDFSSANLTTSYTQVIASTTQDIKSIQVQNQGSAPVYIAVGAAASEIVQYIALAGHDSAVVPVGITSGSRIAIRSGSGTITSGFFVINAIG